MKVAYLFSRYPVPSQTFCDTEMRALEEMGIEVEIFSISPPPTSFRHGPESRPRRARVHYLPPTAVLEVWESAARRLGQWPAAMIADHTARYGVRHRPERRALHAVYLVEMMRRRGVEHLHAHFTNHATHVAAFARALGGPPFSFTAHAQDFLVDLGDDDLLREMCERAAFVVAVSDYSRDLLVERCPAAAVNIHRIYNGIPLDRWPEPPPTGGGATAAPLRIFSAGRLIEFKGFDLLIDACALLRDRGVPFVCEIAGDGPLRDALAHRIEVAGLPGMVSLPGLLPQAVIQNRMLACDVFALACRVDAAGARDVLPTVILEAMAAARPVVSTRLAGVPEMVDDGRTGLLVDPVDPVAFADALALLAGDPARRASLGSAGREKLRAGFAAADTNQCLAALFRQTRRDGSGAGSPAPAVYSDGAGVACLFAQWSVNGVEPESGFSNFALLHLHAQMRGTRLLALQVNPVSAAQRAARPVHPLTELVARMVEFFPDAMVLEAEWREQEATAHLLEAWRKELGGAFRTEDFLLAARRALYFHRHLAGPEGVRHLHAVGAGALLPAWLLLRLGATRTASFLVPSLLLPAGGVLSESALRRLAPNFERGWIVGRRKLAESLGPAARGDELPATGEGWQLWATTLRWWAGAEAGAVSKAPVQAFP